MNVKLFSILSLAVGVPGLLVFQQAIGFIPAFIGVIGAIVMAGFGILLVTKFAERRFEKGC